MQILDGTLSVEQFKGRRGVFCIGKLATDIGSFKIKDRTLDQYGPGQYKGRFMVESLSVLSENWRNGTYTSILAAISPGGFLINEADDGLDDCRPLPQEPDPLESEAGQNSVLPPTPEDCESPSALALAAIAEAAKSMAEPPAVANDATSAADPRLELFGIEIYPQVVALASPIALDPTVDRQKLRNQINHIKCLGYRFDPLKQHWTIHVAANT